ncbi:MAG TPA: SLBB domain-containing protein [Candidatus Merdenecus merdavium]|nr:SLBB domain-containing protein [Candidatus Merdenecus merdavium]
MDIECLKERIQNSGVVGAGGAGFPTYAKLDQRVNTIILNCAECEPLLRLHRQLLEKHSEEIVKTLHKIGEVLGASEMIIGIKEDYTKTIEALETCMDNYPGVRLGLLEEVYPAGDEVVLIYEVTGKIVNPGGLPIDIGVAVFNVETIYNVYRALEEGVGVHDKLISVVGEVEHPVTVRVPVGTTIDEVVSMAGKITTKDYVYFLGGPMMGSIGTGNTPVTKTTNAVLVLPRDHYIIQMKNSESSIDLKRAAASCCQCTMCTDLCPRKLLGHPVEPALFMRAATCKDIQEPGIFLDTSFCCSCGLCELYSCFQGLSPRTLMTEYKQGLKKAGIPIPKDIVPKPVGPEREYRKVPIKRLISRLGLAQYDKEAPLDDQLRNVKRVKLMLSQHIGAPAVSIVAKGDEVKMGQTIAEAGKGLSVPIHASITGKILEVTEKYVIIER